MIKRIFEEALEGFMMIMTGMFVFGFFVLVASGLIYLFANFSQAILILILLLVFYVLGREVVKG